MIKTDAQRERTMVQIDGFRRALSDAKQEARGKRAAALRGSYEGMIRQLEEEVREYDKLKSGNVAFPGIERLDEIAPFIVRLRIAKGISQTELARRLAVSKQVISRYEENEYQAISIVRLQEVLDALGVKARTTLTA
jgi:HTH-type transcriptional regulator/antitoxin HigA